MTQSLKERLGATGPARAGCPLNNPDGPEAAREIERLEAERDAEREVSARNWNTVTVRAERAEARVAELETGLWPFARYADINDLAERHPDDCIEVPVRDLRAARDLLKSQEQPK